MGIDCNNIKLTRGSKGDKVTQVQAALTRFGYYDGIVDGSYGDMTISSVKQFQKDADLTVDGWVGSETCSTINRLSTLTISLKKGVRGVYVKIVQTKLKYLGYYAASVDGDYGDKTVTSVKSFQTSTKKLLVDGIVGTVTYNYLLTTSEKNKKDNPTGIYTNTKLCETRGGNCLGQITGYHCACHCIRQGLRKFGITGYSESTIGGYAGTTTAGTGHAGIETALAKIAKNEGITLKVEWKNLSDFGKDNTTKYTKIGEILESSDKFCFIHLLYRNQYGHYEHIKTVNTKTGGLVISNSLGDKCNSPAYCGYNENRTMNTENSYISGISQKSVCIVTKL